MKSRVFKCVLEIKRKITFICRENTLLDYLKCETNKSVDAHFIFLDLQELHDTTAEAISEHLITCLAE